jgi:hypothetical protein
MPARPHDEPPADNTTDRDRLNAVIGDHVIHALGRPGDHYRVQVRRLWADRYRVNVLVGGDITTTTVAHSYFLVADDGGNISAASPTITKWY